MTRNHWGDVFAIAALLVFILAASSFMQGGVFWWALSGVMAVGAVVLGGLAWIGWNAPRDGGDR